MAAVIRFYGHIPDMPDYRDLPLKHLVRATHLPDSIDWSPLCDQVQDQGQTGSCVGWAMSTAAYVRAKIQQPGFGTYPSAMAAYFLGREHDYGLDVKDIGSRPRAMILGLIQFGWPTADEYPFDPAKVNEPVPWRVLRKASDHRLGIDGYYRCRGSLEVRQALAAGHPVAMALRVGQSFCEANTGDTIPVQSETPATLPGHMVCALGYAPGKVKIVNSWGESWAENGFGWVSNDYIDSPYCSDIWALSVSPLGA